MFYVSTSAGSSVSWADLMAYLRPGLAALAPLTYCWSPRRQYYPSCAPFWWLIGATNYLACSISSSLERLLSDY